MRFKVANYSRLEIRLDTLHICNSVCLSIVIPETLKPVTKEILMLLIQSHPPKRRPPPRLAAVIVFIHRPGDGILDFSRLQQLRDENLRQQCTTIIRHCFEARANDRRQGLLHVQTGRPTRKLNVATTALSTQHGVTAIRRTDCPDSINS